MTANEVANVLQSLLLISLIAVLLLRWWAAARLDGLRQDLFIIRDELFDYAMARKIGFNDPAYRLLRQFLNGMIRYGHQLTFFRIAITVFQIKVVAGNFEPKWSAKWDAALTRVDPQVRDALNVFHARAMSRAANHVVFGSPSLLLLVACTIVVLGVKQGWHNIRELFARAPEKTLTHVVDTKVIENEAAAYAAA